LKHRKHRTLSGRERALWEYFQSNPGRIISRDELSVAVWGFVLDGRSRVIDQTIATLRKKLPANQILTRRGQGYECVQ
jgi:DNA-binding response OmpR family regulator